MSRLPITGSISGSQIGVYAFSRSPTAEFSLSSSLQQGLYGTIFVNNSGLQWPGYNKVTTATNISMSAWNGYAVSKAVSLGSGEGDETAACNNIGGAHTVYVDNNADLSESSWAIGDVVGAGTYAYSNAQGTTGFVGLTFFYGYAIIGGNYSVKIDDSGLVSECTECP